MSLIIEGGVLCPVCKYVATRCELCPRFYALGHILCRRCCRYNRSCNKLAAIHPETVESWINNIWSDDVGDSYEPRRPPTEEPYKTPAAANKCLLNRDSI